MAASAIRFAAGPILKSLRNILVPMTQAGKPAYGQLAARYAPDLLYAGLASTMVPPGATGTDRLGVAAEDLGIGLTASVLPPKSPPRDRSKSPTDPGLLRPALCLRLLRLHRRT